MSCFAKIDKNGVVTQVIVATQDVIDSGMFGDPTEWVETDTEGKKRNKYAGIGHIYHKELDSFIDAKPKQVVVEIEEDELELDVETKTWKMKDKQGLKSKLIEAEVKRKKDKVDGKIKLERPS